MQMEAEIKRNNDLQHGMQVEDECMQEDVISEIEGTNSKRNEIDDHS